jgi:hypothetical protein
VRTPRRRRRRRRLVRHAGTGRHLARSRSASRNRCHPCGWVQASARVLRSGSVLALCRWKGRGVL